jgi:hypothetical protein
VLVMKIRQKVAGRSVPSGGHFGRRNPFEDTFLLAPHFFCNSCSFFLLEGSEDKSVQPGRRKLSKEEP